MQRHRVRMGLGLSKPGGIKCHQSCFSKCCPTKGHSAAGAKAKERRENQVTKNLKCHIKDLSILKGNQGWYWEVIKADFPGWSPAQWVSYTPVSTLSAFNILNCGCSSGPIGHRGLPEALDEMSQTERGPASCYRRIC